MVALKYDSNNPQLLNSVVVFQDILGFSEMVKESVAKGTSNGVLQTLHKILRDSLSLLEPDSMDRWRIKVFTDNVVIGYPIRDDAESELGFTFMNLAAYQLALALEGFFVRGGISVGPHYMDDELVFGPALIEAHEIESIKARDPRIVLSSRAIALVNNHLTYYAEPSHSPQNSHLLIDVDGQWFVNYLSCVLEKSPSTAAQILLKHKEQVVLKLEKYKNQPQIWSKYAWIARYHNYFCTAHYGSLNTLLIDSSSLLLTPVSII